MKKPNARILLTSGGGQSIHWVAVIISDQTRTVASR